MLAGIIFLFNKLEEDDSFTQLLALNAGHNFYYLLKSDNIDCCNVSPEYNLKKYSNGFQIGVLHGSWHTRKLTPRPNIWLEVPVPPQSKRKKGVNPN